MTNATFTKRKLEKITIKRVDFEPDRDYAAITTTEHSGFIIPTHVAPVVNAGEDLYVEYYKFNEIGGLMREDGCFLFHRSDEYFQMKFDQWLIDQAAKREKYYQENHIDWGMRTQALEPRYKARIQRFLDEDTNDEFKKEPMGWGYELTICELAQMYEESAFHDTPEINEYASKHGTSGAQHEVAKTWARNPGARL